MVLTEIQSHQLFYYMSKKKYVVPPGNIWASLLSTCDFCRKMNKIQNKQNLQKENNAG